MYSGASLVQALCKPKEDKQVQHYQNWIKSLPNLKLYNTDGEYLTCLGNFYPKFHGTYAIDMNSSFCLVVVPPLVYLDNGS